MIRTVCMHSNNGGKRIPIALVEDNSIGSIYFMGNPPCSGKNSFFKGKSLPPVLCKKP